MAAIVLAKDFPFHGQVVELKSTATIDEALTQLIGNGITSAPVYDEAKERYMGFFDVSDALALIFGINLMKTIFPKSKLREQTLNVHGVDIDLSYSANLTGTDIPVSHILTVKAGGRPAQTAPWSQVTPDADLLKVVEKLAEKVPAPWSPCRRVPVVDPTTGRVTHIISQSAMVAKIYESVVKSSGSGSESEPIFIQTPRSTGIGIVPSMFYVSESDPVKKAFELIVEKRISAIPVLSAEGKVVDSVTNKDIWYILRILNDSVTNHAQLSTKDFLEQATKLSIDDSSIPVRGKTIAVNEDTPIDVIITKLAMNKVHRVFILDEKDVLVGVLSVSDVVKAMFNNEFPWPRSLVVDHISHDK